MRDLTNPHDKFFKETFSRIEVARDFFINYLPETVTAVLDFDTLTIQPDSFVDADLQEQFADLLYRIQLKDGSEAYLYALLEHKSYPDPDVPFQFLRYMVRIWEKDRREKEPLRPIVPILVYHGRETWRISTDFGDFFSGSEALRPYWPRFSYELQDLSAYSEDEIRGEAHLQIGILLLKYIFDATLNEHLGDILSLFNDLVKTRSTLEYLRTVLYYIGKASKHLKPEEMTTAVQLLLDDGGNEIMQTVAEYWIEQGVERGIKQGIMQGIEQGVMQGIEQGVMQGIEQGVMQGIEQGVMQGIEQERQRRVREMRDIARRLLDLHGVVTVSELTGLAIEEVSEIKENMEK